MNGLMSQNALIKQINYSQIKPFQNHNFQKKCNYYMKKKIIHIKLNNKLPKINKKITKKTLIKMKMKIFKMKNKSMN